MKRRLSEREGFSQVELLVTLGILMVVFALAVPVFSVVRANQRKAQCLSNLKQISVGVQGYCNDHRGHFPMHLGPNPARPPWGDPYLSWMGLVAPYLFGDSIDVNGPISRVFYCPASPYPYNPAVTYKSEGGASYQQASYGINFLFTTDWGRLAGTGVNAAGRNIPRQRVDVISQFVIIAENPLLENLPNQLPVALYPGEHKNLSRRHRGQSHLLHADGRVALVDPKDVLPGGRAWSQAMWVPAQ